MTVLYATSRNLAVDKQFKKLLYLGEDIKEAEKAVGIFEQYEKSEDLYPRTPLIFSALPESINRELIQFYMTGGWWYSIERFEL